LFTENQDVKKATGSLIVDRADEATFFDDYGVLRIAVANELRRNSKGALIEPTSKNWLHPSDGSNNTALGFTKETFNSVKWAEENVQRLTETTDTGQRRLRDTTANTTDFALGDVFTTSAYVQTYGDRDNIAILVEFDGSNIVEFMLSDDSVGDIYTPNQTIIDTKITRYKSGICRLDITIEVTKVPSSNTVGLWLFFSNEYGNGNTTYTGDGVSYLDYFGSQIEKLPFATSYIFTVDDAVERIQDNPYIQSLGNIAGQNCTIALEIEQIGILGTGYIFASYLNGNDFIRLFNNGEGSTLRLSYAEDGKVVNHHHSNLENGVAAKIVYTITKDFVTKYLNDEVGVSVANEHTFTATNLLNQPISFGSYSPGSLVNWCGYIKNFRIFKAELSESDRGLL
jgi:hypothetical protein